MSDRRHRARILAMQALCQWDVQGNESPDALNDLFVAMEAEADVAEHARRLVQLYWSQRQRVDDRIAAAATGWDLQRISPVERNAMRVAVVEWLEAVIPAKVALDEAIEIGREFGGADSPRFINGVLDVILRRLSKHRRVHD